MSLVYTSDAQNPFNTTLYGVCVSVFEALREKDRQRCRERMSVAHTISN